MKTLPPISCTPRSLYAFTAAALSVLLVGCADKRPASEVAQQNGMAAGICELALDFVYPVLGVSAVNGATNTIDPREDGWNVWNCFGNSCDGCGTGVCSGNCTESEHPGDDWNRAPSSCDPKADAGELVVNVGNGTVVDVHRVTAARGWVVIVRHDLPVAVDVSAYTHGVAIPDGERWVNHVYSVYLHLDEPDVTEGQCVTRGQRIGRIANMSSGPHLHFEMVRPTAVYERLLSRKPEPAIAGTASGYYATLEALVAVGHILPSAFIRDHRLTWHPASTLVRSPDGRRFLVDEEQGRLVRRPLASSVFVESRFDETMVVDISQGEFECYDEGTPVAVEPRVELRKVPGVATVWRVDRSARTRAAFLSMESLRSFGFHPGEILEGWDGTIGAFSWLAFQELPAVGLRDGSLFRTISDAPVYLVSRGARRHVTRQDVFLRLGWLDAAIVRIGDRTEGVLTQSLGAEIRPQDLWRCENGRSERSTEDCRGCTISMPDSGSGACTVTGAEECDGADNDCNGATDEGDPGGGVACSTGGNGRCASGKTACRGGTLGCIADFAATAESCNSEDDDCDGLHDEDFDFASDSQNCGSCARSCVGNETCSNGRCASIEPPEPPQPGSWSVVYESDDTVASIVKLEAWATAFTWHELSCTGERTVNCLLPGDPGPEFQVSATVVLADGSPGWSCHPLNGARCSYAIRGTMRLVSPDGAMSLLAPVWNRVEPDHCFGCNASRGLRLSCDPALPTCGD